MITGFNHLNLSVMDIERSFRFYHELLGLQPLCKWPYGAYLLAGNDWFCLNVTDKRKVTTRDDYTHYAFAVSADKFSSMVEKLKDYGVLPFKENLSEGQSFYFLDPDGHQLELHVGDWRTRLEAKKLNPWPGVKFFV